MSTNTHWQFLRNFMLVVMFMLMMLPGEAQLTSGLTYKKDTSFSNRSAYLSARKSHPEIQLSTIKNLPTVSVKKQIVYGKAGTRLLTMDAFWPKTKSKLPRVAVIMIHGGGWRSGSPQQHAPLAEQLAALGYVCFTPEYRLSTEALFPAAIFDVKAAIRWVRKNAVLFQIDTAKIVAAGFSAGAEMASFMATTGNMPLFEGFSGNDGTASHVNALVNIDGTFSFVHKESSETVDTSRKISASTYWFGYTQRENFGLLQAGSPLTYAGAQTPPSLIINSAVERMHAGRDDYLQILNKYNTYTAVHTLDNTPHTFCLFEPWFRPTIEYIDAFLKKVFNLTTT